MNLGMNNPADFPSEKEPDASLLLTPKEVYEIHDESEHKRYIYACRDEGKELMVFGLPHQSKEDMGLKEAFEIFKPDCVMIERSVSDELVGGSLEASIKKGGESGAAIYLAREAKIPVVSWNIPRAELMKEAFKVHPPSAVMGYLIGHFYTGIMEEGDKPDYKRLQNYLLSRYLEPNDKFASRELIDVVCQHYAGKNFDELSPEDARELDRQDTNGEPNKASAWINDRMDTTAVEKIWDQLKLKSQILVVAGGFHATRWKPVFEDLMGPAEQLS